MTLSYYLHRALSLPPWESAWRGLRLAGRLYRQHTARQQALAASGYLPQASATGLARLLRRPPLDLLAQHAETRRRLATQMMSHRFDLLGSGWIDVGLHSAPPGLENHRYAATPRSATPPAAYRRNAAESTRISAMLPSHHQRIDWQRDHRSGYRWSGDTWHQDIRYGDIHGADVKWPWELGRMQHLPLLALAAVDRGELTAPSEILRLRDEILFQMLDFIAANPPGWGVQWACTMDVAIRVANWLVALDLLATADLMPEPAAAAVILRSIEEHGDFIFRHLEWNPSLRGNHFLCNLAGLAFCAAYLPDATNSNHWLAYTLVQLPAEINLQFSRDGGNFEASSTYHRLSLETALFGMAALDRVPAARRAMALANASNLQAPGWPPDWPPPGGAGKADLAAAWQRLGAALAVSAALADGDGRVEQFGDNDNGRFLKLDPAYTAWPAGKPIEDHLDQRHLLGILAEAIPEDMTMGPAAGSFRLDAWLLRALCGVRPPLVIPPRNQESGTIAGLGLHYRRNPAYRLIMRCGDNGQRDHGGHCHNDQLSFTLNWADRRFIIDAGTYIYTPLPQRRQQFRATASHNTLAVTGMEQNQAAPDSLFRMVDTARAQVLHTSGTCIIGEHRGFAGSPHRRRFDCEADTLTITDHYEGGGEAWLNLLLAPDCLPALTESGLVHLRCGNITLALDGKLSWQIVERVYSPGYGSLQPSQGLRARFCAPQTTWRIRRL